jgi:membrane fusion protein (multidrug efflux system)
MNNQQAPKTGQSRLRDYFPAQQPGSRAAQTPSPVGTRLIASDSPVTTDTGTAPVEKETHRQPEAKTEDRSLAFSPTLKMPGLFARSQSVRKMNKRFLLIGSFACLAVLLIAGGLFAWVRIRTLPPAVMLYQVGTQSYTQDIGGGGIVYPLQEEDISYPIAERALAVLVAPGQHVIANQPLIRLDLAALNAQLLQASNDVVSARSYLIAVEASRNTVAIAQAQQFYNLAVDKYNALVAEASSSTLHNGTVISPINGIVTSLYIEPGEIFAANRTMVVIMDESTVIVRAEMPLTYLAQVQVGQAAAVTPSSLPDVTLQGKISTIIPQADSQTDTFEIWVQVANPLGLLLPGMNAFVYIHNAGKALAVPRLAVLNPERESIVFVVRENRAYIQKVQIVARSVDTIYVDTGISAGDRVVLVGEDVLQNGQEVSISGVESQSRQGEQL